MKTTQEDNYALDQNCLELRHKIIISQQWSFCQSQKGLGNTWLIEALQMQFDEQTFNQKVGLQLSAIWKSTLEFNKQM